MVCLASHGGVVAETEKELEKLVLLASITGLRTPFSLIRSQNSALLSGPSLQKLFPH